MNDFEKQAVFRTEAFVKKELRHAEGGHDWWHTLRVRNLSRQIAASERVDILTVELGALLHDIADSKFHNGMEEYLERFYREWEGLA